MFSTNNAGTIGYPYGGKMNHFTQYTKINLRWIKDLKVKGKTNLQENFCDFEVGSNIWDRTQNAMTIKEKNLIKETLWK